jgi:hypothetical protein
MFDHPGLTILCGVAAALFIFSLIFLIYHTVNRRKEVRSPLRPFVDQSQRPVPASAEPVIDLKNAPKDAVLQHSVKIYESAVQSQLERLQRDHVLWMIKNNPSLLDGTNPAGVEGPK